MWITLTDWCRPVQCTGKQDGWVRAILLCTLGKPLSTRIKNIMWDKQEFNLYF